MHLVCRLLLSVRRVTAFGCTPGLSFNSLDAVSSISSVEGMNDTVTVNDDRKVQREHWTEIDSNIANGLQTIAMPHCEAEWNDDEPRSLTK